MCDPEFGMSLFPDIFFLFFLSVEELLTATFNREKQTYSLMF